jgi:hypothetical protein
MPMTEPLTRTNSGGSVPSPDPTVLTTQALFREISAVRELFEQRLAGRDRELTALSEHLIALVDAETKLTNERLQSAERQRIEQKIDTKSAVDAALIAQKEAVREQTTASERAIAKSEAATTKQLEQQALTVATAVDALRRSIDELKERAVEENRAIRVSISEVATSSNSLAQQKVGAKEDRTAVYAAIGICVTLALATITIVGFVIANAARI